MDVLMIFADPADPVVLLAAQWWQAHQQLDQLLADRAHHGADHTTLAAAETAAHATLELLLVQLATTSAHSLAGVVARLEVALFWGCAFADEMEQPPWSLVKATLVDLQKHCFHGNE